MNLLKEYKAHPKIAGEATEPGSENVWELARIAQPGSQPDSGPRTSLEDTITTSECCM